MSPPDDERGWRDGLVWGLAMLGLAVLSEGGLFLLLVSWLKPPGPREWMLFVGFALVLFVFGWIYGVYRPRR